MSTVFGSEMAFNSFTTTNNLTSTNSALLANALIQQIQQQNLNNKFFNNNILLNCIKSNLAANLNSGSNTSLNSQNQDNPKQINYSRYKTELCRQFSENGECKYGDKCQFAHGFNDLKDVNRHPKYKTDYCKTFHSKGFCPYGPRCHFIHEFYEKSDLELNDKVKPTKSALNNTKSNNQEIDNQLEAIQAQLASSLFSTIVDRSASLSESAENLDSTDSDQLDEQPSSLSSTLIEVPNNSEQFEKEHFIKLLNRIKSHSSETSSQCSLDSRTRTSSSVSNLSSDYNDGTNDSIAEQQQIFSKLNDEDIISIKMKNSHLSASSQIDDFNIKFDHFLSFTQ